VFLVPQQRRNAQKPNELFIFWEYNAFLREKNMVIMSHAVAIHSLVESAYTASTSEQSPVWMVNSS